MSNPEDLRIFIEEFDPNGQIQRDGQEIILLDECRQLQQERGRFDITEAERTELRAKLTLAYYCLTQIDERRARLYKPVFDFMQQNHEFRSDGRE